MSEAPLHSSPDGRSPGGALVEVFELEKHYRLPRGLLFPGQTVQALRGVSLNIRRGETLGLVGESGSGKSTLGRCLVRLERPSSGRVLFEGRDISTGDLGSLRRRVQMVFQDPYASLNPKMTVRQALEEPLRIHGLTESQSTLDDRVDELLGQVGIRPGLGGRYPHAFSGGQRQRVGIARALAAEPDFMVCDEPISALDVSIQGQVLNLLMDLQEELRLTLLFISHDLRAVQSVSHRVAVMYLGRIVEVLPSQELANQARHPYTRALLDAIPVAEPREPRRRRRLRVVGELPSPVRPPVGCAFHPRCPGKEPGVCDVTSPALEGAAPGADHQVACFHPVL